MSIQTIRQSYPFSPNPSNTPANIVDGISALVANTPQWSLGSASLSPAMLGGPGIDQNWSILSVAFQAYHGMEVAVTRAFGKLGKITAGLVIDNTGTNITQSPDGSPWIPSYSASPIQDSTLTTDIWTPENDPLPPIDTSIASSSPNNTLLIEGSLLPPNPIALDPGVNIYVGLWILPSLLGLGAAGAFFRYLVFTSYVLSYDDGL